MKKQILLLALFILLEFNKANCQTQTHDWIWAKGTQSSANGDGEGCSIAVDTLDNLFITGYYGSNIAFGTDTLPFQSSPGVFLAKYDSNGNIKWAKSNSASGHEVRGYSVCTDVFGNSYISGYFQDSAIFGTHTLSAIANNDDFFS